MRHLLGPLICLLTSAETLLMDYMWRCNPMKAQLRDIGKTAISQRKTPPQTRSGV
jgi:hypothetical protein